MICTDVLYFKIDDIGKVIEIFSYLLLLGCIIFDFSKIRKNDIVKSYINSLFAVIVIMNYMVRVILLNGWDVLCAAPVIVCGIIYCLKLILKKQGN